MAMVDFLRRWDPHGSPYPMGGLETSPLAADSFSPEEWGCGQNLVGLWRRGAGRTDGSV